MGNYRCCELRQTIDMCPRNFAIYLIMTTLATTSSLALAEGPPAITAPAAPNGGHWAFQQLHPAVPPPVKDGSRIRTAIDAFIQTRLEATGLTLGPEANRRALIRRVSFDLTGLPPTPEEIDVYLHDPSPGAYEAMVERYLASPRYGERWGKYWLDVAGYADSNGYFGADTDRPLAYKYRDYVIRSINADKPFDQFVREQLAGDELAGYDPKGDMTPEVIEALTATHFLRNSADGTDSSDGNPDEVRADKYAVLEGTLQIIGSSLFGLTLQCARCHDHKFEPITQREYYQLQAVIYPAFNIEKWVKPGERQMIAATAAEKSKWEETTKAIEHQIAKCRREFAAWARENRERGRVLFTDDFDGPDRMLGQLWSNAAPGDEAPAGQPAIHIDSATAPGAEIVQGALRIIESGAVGDRALSTRRVFDWTPETEGAWIQVTFDLKAGGDTAPYVGYFIALRDFNDTLGGHGGNVLLDGAVSGKAAVHVDYPGSDSQHRGAIGMSGYVPGGNYGVRVTNVGGGKFELAQLVEGVPEEGTLQLIQEDLPDGGFGFEYCCGRSFVIDHLVIESGEPSPDSPAKQSETKDRFHKKRREHLAAIAALEVKKNEQPGRLAAVTDLAPQPPEVFLLERGLYNSPGEKVDAAAPAVLSDPEHKRLVDDGAMTNSTGRRLALAQWFTKPDSGAAALLARVTVNRWWQHHFGTGIVATPENLGASGSPPSHLDLLDHLADQFVKSGWSAKSLHRLILRSSVYRQTATAPEDAIRIDPDNKLLSRYPMRRLDAEAIRDGMLASSGELDTRMGGAYVATTRDAEGDVVVDESVDGARRRSVYLQQRRTQVLGLLEAFDAPSIVFNCTQRIPTTVPLQSLKLLNSNFIRLRAAAFVRRLEREAGQDPAPRLERAFVVAWGRPPSAEELAAAARFLAVQPAEYPDAPDVAQQAWIDLANMLLASNAALYVE